MSVTFVFSKLVTTVQNEPGTTEYQFYNGILNVLKNLLSEGFC